MASNTNQKNTESYVCIHIDKMCKNPEGYSSFLKEAYQIGGKVPDCVYIALPSGRETKLRGMPQEKFNELVDDCLRIFVWRGTEEVGYAGCSHAEHSDIKICRHCDVDGSNYNGRCEREEE